MQISICRITFGCWKGYMNLVSKLGKCLGSGKPKIETTPSGIALL